MLGENVKHRICDTQIAREIINVNVNYAGRRY